MMVKKAAVGLAALALALSACSSGDDEGSAFDEAASASPSTPAATPAADTPEPEPSTAEPAEDEPTATPPTFDTDWNPTLYPDDPDGPKFITDTIDLKVGDPVVLPFDGTTVYAQDGGKALQQGDGVGTECLRSQPSDPWSPEIAEEAAGNSPYRNGTVFFAQCPADVRLVLLNTPDATGPDGVAHQYNITITE